MEKVQISDESAVIPLTVIEEKVRAAVAESLELDMEDVHLSSSLFGELGAESLDLLDASFILEREFRIQFPRTDILERATQHFGEDALIINGRVTEFGVKLLRQAMPEVEPEAFQPNMLAMEVAEKITVQSLVRIVTRLLEAKAAFPRQCPNCGSLRVEADVLPELICPQCGESQLLPTGDEIMIQDLKELGGEVETS